MPENKRNPSHHLPSEPPPHSASDSIPHVPKELLDELHTANADLSSARHEREEAMDVASYSDTPRQSAKRHVNDAEKHIEDVTQKIDQILHRADKAGSDSAGSSAGQSPDKPAQPG